MYPMRIRNPRLQRCSLFKSVCDLPSTTIPKDLMMADTDQIKVVIRVRPLIQKEQQNELEARWSVQDEKLISQRGQSNLPPYAFDQVYDRDCSTWELYSGVIGPIVEAAMNGYHGTVFAYGQSGSGKTYTMSGDKMTPGIIALAMDSIFDFIEQKPSHEFLMRASYMEIYNEKICDLLCKEDNHLKIHETPDHQINVVGLVEELVHSCEHVLSVIQKGEAKRKFAETKQNDRSSRSHCIFRIIIESRKRTETAAAVMVSHLNFVDLAGSEKAGENSGDRFREGCSINMSLFCLSNVISKLSEGIGKQFIGYRDSKLTRILQNALGGNSKTVIVATINPTTVEESHSTLRFATRAKTIKNKPHVNEVLSDAALLKKYRNQITELEKLVKDIGVADIQSANEDLKKQLEEKQSLIEHLTKHFVVSSVTDKSVQKKKARRETWCAPKLRRKSYFPSLGSVPHPSVTIREETETDLELDRNDNLSLPFTNISAFGNDESGTKAFLRRSDELAISEPLLSAPSGSEEGWRLSGGTNLEEEVERLEEVMRVMEEEHTKEVEKLEERIKQLEYEKALDRDLQEERDNNLASGQEEVTILKEKMAHKEYECQLHLEENQLLQKVLWHAEEDVKRLREETCHLCDKRFDFSLREWEELKAAKTSLEAEMKQLVANLQQKDKDIEELQKALAGQEPYITRLEQQLETYMGSGNGQLGGGGEKRRSGIPVLIKPEEKESPKPAKIQQADSSAVVSESKAVEASLTTMVDCATSTEDLQQISASHTPEAVSNISQQLSFRSEHEQSSEHVAEATNSTTPFKISETAQNQKAHGEAQNADVYKERDVCNTSALSFKREYVFTTHVDRSLLSDELKSDEMVTPERAEGTKPVFISMESSTKRATRLKRRSDGKQKSPEANIEICARLREREQELEQATSENLRLLEVLNQANAETLRYKEAMEAMEQADAERMEELSEVPKLRALLNRRDMEIHRLESLNDCLKEDLNQQMLNSSVSSLSSSFTEPRRKSAMLKEREAEIWKLKDQLIQQAKRLDDVQQEKIHLEDMMSELHTQPVDGNEAESNDDKDRLSPCSSASSSAPSVMEVNTSVKEEEEELLQVMVTEAKMESVKRMISDKDSQISHLKALLQEKEEEMEQMFEGQMLVSSDMIQSHLQQAGQQRDKIEELEGQLKSREEDIAKLKARAELHRGSSTSSASSQGEDSAFLEQLIMDKMALEESLQEKALELSQILDQKNELQVQLDERRAVVNKLRQQFEDTTEALLSTQEELITLKRSRENELAKNTANQSEHTAELCTEEALPATKEDDSLETFKTQSAETTGQPPVEEPLPSKEDDSSFEISFKMTGTEVRDGDSKNDDEVSFKTTDTTKDDDEVSFKTTDTEIAAPSDSHYTERIGSLEQREDELLEMLKEKEQQVQTLLASKEQSQKSSATDSDNSDKSPEAGNITTEDTTCNTTEVPLEEQCEALMEQNKSLENRLQNALSAVEEKTILQDRVAELLKVVDEKSSVISQLQKQCGEMSSQRGSLQGERDEPCMEPTDGETWTVEKESLLARLSHLSHVEECLENNIKMLEQSQEEKAAMDERVRDLEAKLEQLTRTEEREGLGKKDLPLNSCSDVQSCEGDVLQAEKKALEAQMKEKTTELESVQSEIQQLRSLNDLILSQKTELESKVQDLKTKEKTLQDEIQQTDETGVHLAEAVEQCQAMETKMMELSAKIDEQTSSLEQLTSEHEEVNTELTWQTKENERLQSRVEELETELEEKNQEAEDVVQELEKVQKLQEDSEQCQRVVEETLENFKAQNAKLEEEKHSLATERDQFEIQAEAAVKDQEHLRLELKVTRDRLQNRISGLELELGTMKQRKEVLEAALADRDSAQCMGGLLHEKLSVDLQESQAEVGAMKTTLSQLQFQLQSQESKSDTLNKIIVSLEAEKAQWGQDKSSLEEEKLELVAKLSSLEDQVHSLQKDLGCRLAVEKTNQALESQVQGHHREVEQLQGHVQRLSQQVEADRTMITQLRQEREEARTSCKELSGKTSRLESRCTQAELECQRMTGSMKQLQQERDEAERHCKELSGKASLQESRCMQAELECQHMIHRLQQLQQAGENNEQEASSARSECSRLQDELGSKLEYIEQLEKQLADLKASGDSSSAGEKMIPLIEVKKQKLVMRAKIKELAQQLEFVKNAAQCKDAWINELHEKLSKYENEEQEDKDEKIVKLEEAIQKLEDGLKAKDMELVGIKMQQQGAISKLTKQLSHAEEMVTYKEQFINKLKGELRRIRSEEVSFCSSAAPKAKAPEPVKPAEDDRAISSHSGIIDRYTVMLLEADKYKLQKELKKTQDRLKSRESELHWTKVALAKAKAGDGSSPLLSPSTSENVTKPKSNQCEIIAEQKSTPALQMQPSVVTPPSACHSAGCVQGEQHSSSSQRIGTSVDGGLVAGDSVSRGAGDSLFKSTSDSASRDSGMLTSASGSASRTGSESASRTWRQDTGQLQSSLSANGTSVDLKRDRAVLPSTVDKENTPFGTDVLSAQRATSRPPAQGNSGAAGAESPINIEPEFWKKPRRPKSSSVLGKSATAGADQCKTQ